MTSATAKDEHNWLDASPYPGARPLGSEPGDERILQGRSGDIDRFVILVSSYQVVELTSASGVGKSSLLSAGLIPKLRSRGAKVGLLQQWARVAGDAQESYYAAAVKSACQSQDVECGGHTGAALLEFLVVTYGSALVLVFDQLEELFRDDPRLGRRFLGEVKEAAEKYPFHQVLSLRSEFKAELSGLEEALSQTLWRPFPLRPVEDETIRLVVESPAKEVGVRYETEAVDAISMWWTAARSSDWQIGLLHLQALLWVLFVKVNPSPGDLLSLKKLTEGWNGLPQSAQPADTSGDEAVSLFELALKEFVALRLRRPEEMPDVYSRERLFAAARLAPQLSSEGFKLIRDASELASTVLPKRENLSIHQDFWDAAVKAGRRCVPKAPDLLPTGDEIKVLLLNDDWSPENIGQTRENPSPSGPGNRERTAGRLHGALPFYVVCEAIAAFEGALRLLEAAWIIRITPTQRGQTRVSLVHDGFGRALDAWSLAVLDDALVPIESLIRLTATDIFLGNIIRREEIPQIEKVRWVGCFVEADFRGVTFRGAELDATLFYRCRFIDVVFEDCKMWGTLFEGCTFEGKTGTIVRGPFYSGGLQSLTLRACAFMGGGLRLIGQNGYGLFLRACEGGPWTIEESTLSLVGIDGGENGLHDGSVVNCPLLEYVSVSGNLLSKPTVRSSHLMHFESGDWAR